MKVERGAYRSPKKLLIPSILRFLMHVGISSAKSVRSFTAYDVNALFL